MFLRTARLSPATLTALALLGASGCRKAKPQDAVLALDLGDGVRLELVRVAPGRFMMGSDSGEKSEKPVHEVAVTQAFYLGRHEVTRAQFEAFVKATGYRTDAEKAGKAILTKEEFCIVEDGASWKAAGFAQTGGHPVTCVSWNDAAAFCEWLSGKSGRACRLPTEAEWEYACRAGSTGEYACAEGASRLADYAWYDARSAGDGKECRTHPVGRKRANAWGLHDMHGSVWEWCADRYDAEYYSRSPRDDPAGPETGDKRVRRGGGWGWMAECCRSAYREGAPPAFCINDMGFRIAASAEKR